VNDQFAAGPIWTDRRRALSGDDCASVHPSTELEINIDIELISFDVSEPSSTTGVALSAGG
jgi:hypothetical protein